MLPHSEPTRKIINQTLSFRASEGRLQIKKKKAHHTRVRAHARLNTPFICRHPVSLIRTHTHTTKSSSSSLLTLRLYPPLPTTTTPTLPCISLLGPLVPMAMCGQRCLGGVGERAEQAEGSRAEPLRTPLRPVRTRTRTSEFSTLSTH